MNTMTTPANLKQEAARQALQFVENGMVLGLGTGSTTAFFIDLLGEKFQRGELVGIIAVPTSEGTAARARALGIPLTSLTELATRRSAPVLDLVVDGADEVDPQLNMIKGLGRALLREKIIEIQTGRFIVIVDDSKLVARLGSKVALQVEILPFEAGAHIAWLNTLGCRAEQWKEADGSPVVTDNGNYLALCRFADGIPDAYALALQLAQRAGIIEHGLFMDMADQVIVAGAHGVQQLERNAPVQGRKHVAPG
jgi:ribose 5-phosphate isomerase A